jgi:hypothetical protein
MRPVSEILHVINNQPDIISEQALHLARVAFTRAQKETQDAFLRYTACLDAERSTRQAVLAAEKRRDDISMIHSFMTFKCS